MPGIRLPFTHKRQLAPGDRSITLSTAGVDGAAPPPPLTYDDPRLRAFLSVTFDVLYDWNIQTGAIYFSEQLDEMLGLPSGGFPRSLEGWLECIHPDDHERAGYALWASVSGSAPFDCEYRLRRGDGSYVVVHDQGAILTDAGNEPTNMIGAMRDVTREHEARLALREASVELTRSERALRRQATILDERNTALRVLLEQREQDRRELEQRVVHNVEQLIEPTLDRLSHALRHRAERLELEALRVNLHEIVGPFGPRIAGVHGAGPPLTRRETEVANLVRLGKSSTEIAEALHISASSVAFHRANIRRKLGLPKRGPQLATHLASLARD
ncbi:MAG: PAS domain-containing protein [Thermoleophilia bacterium]